MFQEEYNNIQQSDTVISGQIVPGKTQCGKIGLWLLEGFIIKNFLNTTSLGSRTGKLDREIIDLQLTG